MDDEMIALRFRQSQKQWAEDMAATQAVCDLMGKGFSTQKYTWADFKRIKGERNAISIPVV